MEWFTSCFSCAGVSVAQAHRVEAGAAVVDGSWRTGGGWRLLTEHSCIVTLEQAATACWRLE
eukprot:SAG31_NODE_32736_length_352_cov_0.806324_1_plen_61_part_10